MKSRDLTARKSVIDVLKSGEVIKTQVLSEKADVPIRTLWRILDELKKLGLVNQKDKKYWVWSEYENRWKGSPQEYKVYMNHAKALIPGFKELLNTFPDFWFPVYYTYLQFKPMNKNGETSNTMFSYQKLSPSEQLSILSERAESHLKAYPEIHENLRICKSLKEKYKKADIKTQELLNIVGGAVIPIEEVHDLSSNFNVSKKRLIEEGIPYILGIWGKLPEIFLLKRSRRFKSRESQLITGHKGYVRFVEPYEHHIVGVKGPIKGNFDTEVFEEIIKSIPFVKEAAGELAKQICDLIFQIHQQPLRGTCKWCPNLKIVK